MSPTPTGKQMDHYTLQFVNADGEPVSLFNQSLIACKQIEALQSHMGAHSFRRIDQERKLEQIEMDLIAIVHTQVFGNRRQANDDASV